MHPDRAAMNAAQGKQMSDAGLDPGEAYRQVRLAFEVLVDPDSRKLYDRYKTWPIPEDAPAARSPTTATTTPPRPPTPHRPSFEPPRPWRYEHAEDSRQRRPATHEAAYERHTKSDPERQAEAEFFIPTGIPRREPDIVVPDPPLHTAGPPPVYVFNEGSFGIDPAKGRRYPDPFPIPPSDPLYPVYSSNNRPQPGPFLPRDMHPQRSMTLPVRGFPYDEAIRLAQHDAEKSAKQYKAAMREAARQREAELRAKQLEQELRTKKARRREAVEEAATGSRGAACKVLFVVRAHGSWPHLSAYLPCAYAPCVLGPWWGGISYYGIHAAWFCFFLFQSLASIVYPFVLYSRAAPATTAQIFGRSGSS